MKKNIFILIAVIFALAFLYIRYVLPFAENCLKEIGGIEIEAKNDN